MRKYLLFLVLTLNSFNALSYTNNFVVLTPGQISGIQSGCPKAPIVPFTSQSPASGGTGTYIYQWQKSTVSTTSGFVDIPGATLLTYSSPPLNVKTYFRRAVSTVNDPAVYSNVISYTIFLPVPVGGTIISSVAGVCGPINNSLIVLNNYSGFILKWQSSTDIQFNSNVVDIVNTTSQYTAVNISATTYYRAILYDGPTACKDTSTTFSLIYDTLSNTGYIIGSDTLCSETNSIRLKLEGYSGVVNMWQSSFVPDFSLLVTNIYTTADSLIITNQPQGTLYYRVVFIQGACTGYSTTANIRVNLSTKGGSLFDSSYVDSSITICEKLDSLEIFLVRKIGSVLYWQTSSSPDFTTNVRNINSTNVILKLTNITQTTYIRAVVKHFTCDTAFSNYYSVIILQKPQPGLVVGSDTVCSGLNSTSLTLLNSFGNIAKWQSSPNANFNPTVDIINSTNTLLVTNLNSTTFYRAIISSDCNDTTSGVAWIFVNTKVNGSYIVAPQPDSFHVSGDPDTIKGSQPIGGNGSYYYQWQQSTVSDNANFNILANTNSKDFNPGLLNQTTWYRRIAFSGTCDTNISNVVRILITQDVVIPNNPVIGAALSATPAEIITDQPGSYYITYTLTVENLGDADFNKVSLLENLSNVFLSPSEFSISEIIPPAGFQLNGNFDGIYDVNILDTLASVLFIAEKKTLKLKIKVTPNQPEVIYYNNFIVKASTNIGRIEVTDFSVDGITVDPNYDGLPSEFSNTIVPIKIFIPTGISPNADGINDFFEIEGIENYPNNKLEIYNRWGNKVYEEAPYKNNWNGNVKNASGYIYGNGLLPDGTYFYLLDFGIPNAKKSNGFVVVKK